MSLSVTTDVFCDGPDCLMWTEGVSGRVRVHGVEARRAARSRGWVRRDGKDLCPRCADET